MKLYASQNSTLTRISTRPFELEKDIQNLVEANTETLFGLNFVKSEMSVNNFRIDSLCYDPENKAFVIIEYKKGSNFSVIDQGYTYLSLLLNNKAEFVLEYNETMDDNLRRDDVDWSQSRILFISPRFTEYQRHSVNFKNIPFELWEVSRFANGLVAFDKLETSSKEDISATIVDEESVVKKVSKEVITYDEDFHLYKNKKRPQVILELYHKLKERILKLGDDVEMKVKKQTIGFHRVRPFCDLIINNNGISIFLNLKHGELRDPMLVTKDFEGKGHWGNGDYLAYLQSDDEFEYVLGLIQQAYKKQGE